MKPRGSLAELWESTTPSRQTFDPKSLLGLPETAQRFLGHAISPGSLMAIAVRLRMHGEIKLKRWLPFTAEEVIHGERGFIWTATVRSSRMLMRRANSNACSSRGVAIPTVQGIATSALEPSSRSAAPFQVSRSRPRCGSAGISAPNGSSRRGSSSEWRSTTQSGAKAHP